MHDDTSDIPSSGCSVLTGEHSISHYNGNKRKDFVQNGGKWYLYREQQANYGDYDISGYNCININDLNSYAIYQPFIYCLAVGLFIVSILLFFKTIKGLLHVF